jgi:GntR family transcriptional repressor for pyruvate dehydrogenase complex
MPKVTSEERRSDEAARRILALVKQHKLAPGARLPSERDLAEEIGVSRPILREALHGLAAMGYIDRRSKSGNYMCTALPDSLRERLDAERGQHRGEQVLPFADVLELRKVLEVWAVERVASSSAARAVAAMRKHLQTMRRHTLGVESFEAYQEADLAFHGVLAEATGNMAYGHLFAFLTDLVRRSIALSRHVVSTDFLRENLARHQAILDALEARDPAAAKSAMQAHFALIERHLRRA